LPLETATFIPDLVPNNPAHTDGLAQADSHLRLIKSTLKNTFSNFTDVALASTQAQLDAAVAATKGAGVLTFEAGTAALPGLVTAGDPTTGFFAPAVGEIGISLAGVQVALLASDLLVTTLGIGAAGFASAGAYSGGTGQLVPIGSTHLWWDDALPTEGGYTWANGVPISRTANPILFARWGTRFGAGDGATTFGVPDLREAVPVGKSTMGGAAARGPLSNFVTTVTNALIGAQGVTLQRSDLPNFSPTFTGTAGTVNVTSNTGAYLESGSPIGVTSGGSGGAIAGQSGNSEFQAVGSSGTFTPSGTIASLNGNVTQTSPSVVQPSTIVNFIIRVG